jgi:hypothetical protein
VERASASGSSSRGAPRVRRLPCEAGSSAPTFAMTGVSHRAQVGRFVVTNVPSHPISLPECSRGATRRSLNGQSRG